MVLLKVRASRDLCFEIECNVQTKRHPLKHGRPVLKLRYDRRDILDVCGLRWRFDVSVRRAEDRRGGEGRLARETMGSWWSATSISNDQVGRSAARLHCYPSVRSTTEIMDPVEGPVHGPGEPTCDRCGCNAKLRDPFQSGVWTKQILEWSERSLLCGRAAPRSFVVKDGLG